MSRIIYDRIVCVSVACEQAHVGAQARIARGVAVSAKSSGEAVRRESEPALISANFSFPARKPQKKKYAN